MSKKATAPLAKPPAKLSFSFQRLVNNAKFTTAIPECDHEYFCDVLGRLTALSAMTRDQFVALAATGGKNWRVHQIGWLNDPRLSEKTFGLPPQLGADENAWQFTISLKRGRVHGYLLDSVFYVVWLDPMHALYKGDPN